MKKLWNRIPRTGILLLGLLLGIIATYFFMINHTSGNPPDSAMQSETTSDGTIQQEDSSSETALPSSYPPIADQNFKVVAYYPSWKENGLDKLRFDIITHVNYAFAIPTADGSLDPLDNPGLAQEIISLAHENDAKVLLAVGGWSYLDVPLEYTFKEATSTPEKVKSLGDAIIAMCEEYGFDGVDMDWEYPRLDDGTYAQFEALMLYLAEKLHADDKLLTAAVVSGVMPDGTVYYDSDAYTDNVLAAIDWINVMAYDGGDGQLHSGYDFAVACGNYWHITRGADTSKVVLGVPFYARPSWTAYSVILASDPDANTKDMVISYGTEIWYNGQDTIAAKAKFAAENLGGVMIWEITQDTSDISKSLLTAIREALP